MHTDTQLYCLIADLKSSIEEKRKQYSHEVFSFCYWRSSIFYLLLSVDFSDDKKKKRNEKNDILRFDFDDDEMWNIEYK